MEPDNAQVSFFQHIRNTVLADLGGLKVVYFNHSLINFVGTRDEGFTSCMMEAFQNLSKMSTRLSHADERNWIRFFNRIRDKMKLAARLYERNDE